MFHRSCHILVYPFELNYTFFNFAIHTRLINSAMSTPKPSPRQLWLGGLLIIFIAISAIVVTLHGLTLNLINAKKMAIFVIFHSRKGRSSVQALMLIVPSGQSHYLFPFKFGISTGGLSIILCLSICNYMIYQHYQSWVPRALVGHSFSPRVSQHLIDRNQLGTLKTESN